MYTCIVASFPGSPHARQKADRVGPENEAMNTGNRQKAIIDRAATCISSVRVHVQCMSPFYTIA